MPAFQTGVSPTLIVAGRFTGGPQLDLAILDEGSDAVSIDFGDGKGGFLAGPRFDAGNHPSGLTLVDVNGDGKLDLLIGNEFGDVLILGGDGRGGFSPYQRIDRSITLAVSGAGHPATTMFIFSDRSEDQISVEAPGSALSVLAGRVDGVLAPGQVILLEGGPSCLALDPNLITDPDLPNPTSLAFATLSGGQLEFYATTEGLESASLLAFALEDSAISPGAGAAEPDGVASLVPL